MATDETRPAGQRAGASDRRTGQGGRGGATTGRPRSGGRRPGEVGPFDGPTGAASSGGVANGNGAVGGPAAQRALRTQGRRTMRRLLDAAMKAIDERGYHATRVQDVVDIANTSHGTFYLYFSNKEDLVRALTMEATSETTSMGRTMSEASSDIDFDDWDQLRQWVAGYSIVWSRYAPLFRAWSDLASIDEGIADQIRKMVQAHADAIAARLSVVERADGVDPEVAGLAVIALLDRFHYLREFTGEPVDDAAIDSLTTLIHRALFPGDEGGDRDDGGDGTRP